MATVDPNNPAPMIDIDKALRNWDSKSPSLLEVLTEALEEYSRVERRRAH